MKAAKATSRKRPTRRPIVPTQQAAERIALRYLERFDASSARLRSVVLRALLRQSAGLPSEQAPSREQLEEWVDALVQRYRGSGLVDDARFAANLARSLRERGASRRQILLKLSLKGVEPSMAEAAVAELDGEQQEDAEWLAARRYVRRRRLGAYRPSADREQHRQRDLAALARAGFSFEVARRALETPVDGA